MMFGCRNQIFLLHPRLPSRRPTKLLAPTLAGLALTLCWIIPGPAPAQIANEIPQSLKLASCNIEGFDEQVLCGTLAVYEDRTAKAGRRIDIHVVVAPAISEERQPDPLFILLGGPGVGAAAGAAIEIPRWQQIREHRDLVFVDLRGTGTSNPLTCTPSGPTGTLDRYLVSYLDQEVIAHCRDELSGRANLALYTTTIAMDDLDDVRAALGYEEINVYGTSYGSFAAQVYIRRHGRYVRSAILHAPVPLNPLRAMNFAANIDTAVYRVIDSCAEDERCQKAYPELRADLEAILSQFREAPVLVDVPNPDRGETEQIQLEYDHITELMAMLLYTAEDAAEMPVLIQLMKEKDYEPIGRAVTRIRKSLYATLSWGFYLSVHCTERFPYLDEEIAMSKARGTLIGPESVREEIRACDEWPHGTLPPGFHDPIVSDVPTLIVAGELDPATPPVGGNAIAAHLPNSRVIVLKNTAHMIGETSWSTCVVGLYHHFLESGSADGLDTTCSDEIVRPSFLVLTLGLRILRTLIKPASLLVLAVVLVLLVGRGVWYFRCRRSA